jgi:hypothetical protein
MAEDGTMRVLDSRAIDDDRLLVLFLMNIERGPFSSYSLTDVVLYRKQASGDWIGLAETGWGDGANNGVKSFRVNGEGSMLMLDLLVSGASGERSDLVGYQTVTYQIGKASISQIDKGPMIVLGAEEWPADWAGGVKGPCPIPERVNKTKPEGPCDLPAASALQG